MRLVTLMVLLLAASTLAAEQPIVRAEISPSSVAVGEPVELTITVLVPTWFTRPSIYPSFELANAITRLPEDSSFSMRERVGNESWSGIVRTYEILPLIGANYSLSGQSISISLADPGSDPIVVDVAVPDVTFQGIVPAGAAALDPYIAGRTLDVSLVVEGETTDLEVGDALVLRYEAELDGLPAIFLPPLAPALEWDGVSVYADTPMVSEAATARRSEKLTLVFEVGGEFIIPGLKLQFWNTETVSIDHASAEGFTVSVAGPAATPSSGEAATRDGWLPRAVAIGILALFTGLVAGLGPKAIRRWRAAQEQRRQSEPYAFARLQATLRSNKPARAYRQMLTWLGRLEPGLGARQFAQRCGDETLRIGIETLSMRVYAEATDRADMAQLRRALISARRRFLKQSSDAIENVLPPLNP